LLDTTMQVTQDFSGSEQGLKAMNEQYFGYESSKPAPKALQPIASLNSNIVTQADLSQQTSFMNKPIVLGQKDKEAFIEMVERPAQVNQKLFDAFSKVI
jgi:hypothetical protein